MGGTLRRSVGIVHSERFKDHKTGEGHPESPSRMDAAKRALGAPSLAGVLTAIEPRAATREEIMLVHSDRHYDEVVATRGIEQAYLDSDTVTCPDSSDVAHLAVGAGLALVDAVMNGDVANAFALVRPPGHHAKPDKAMGFCFFNNVAVAAAYLGRRYSLSRVLVIDFDVHHGNGTQKAFYTSPEVLYVSTHQWPHYPGTGAFEEVGKDEGTGFTLNLPLPAGSGDYLYVELFRRVIAPVAHEYRPEFVLVSAGYDAYAQDPLGNMALTPGGYAAITREILAIAGASCGGKSLFTLEGGYNLGGLEKCITATLEVMGGLSTEGEPKPAKDDVNAIVSEVRRWHGQYWTSLK